MNLIIIILDYIVFALCLINMVIAGAKWKHKEANAVALFFGWFMATILKLEIILKGC